MATLACFVRAQPFALGLLPALDLLAHGVEVPLHLVNANISECPVTRTRMGYQEPTVTTSAVARFARILR
jgi:hypothetical protein